MPRLKLNKTNINSLNFVAAGQVDYLDTELEGFGLRVTSKAMTFFVRRTLRGTTKKPFIPIGQYGAFTPEKAREVAKGYIRDLETGKNPHPKEQPKNEIITVNMLYRQYISGRKTPLAASTLYHYEAWMKNYHAEWREKDVTTITGSMVADRLQTLETTAGKVQAVNAMKLLRGLYRIGKALYPDIIKNNTVEAVQALRGRNWTETKRRKTLVSDNDLPLWYKTVKEFDNHKGRDYLLLLLFTGLRKMEAARLEWSDIDFKKKTFAFIPEKKKDKAERVIMPLSNQLYKILLQRRAKYFDSRFVFTGKNPIFHLMNPCHWQADIIEKSGINFCLHDLRRTFITIAESLDIPHYALKALLNHSLGNDVTGGYVVMNPERLREPMQKTADRITELVQVKRVDDLQEKAA